MVIEGLRQTLKTARASFRRQLEGRLQQLMSNMVDGRVLAGAEADALKSELWIYLRDEALPALGKKNPAEALTVLDMLKMYGLLELEAERARYVAARGGKFPPPPAATWPELAALRALAQENPGACALSDGVTNVAFLESLENERLTLPAELIALYAAHDGFELRYVDGEAPQFHLLPSDAIDTADAVEGYPRRAIVFGGQDSEDFTVFRDKQDVWWLSYEYEHQPVAKAPLDLRKVLAHALVRTQAGQDSERLDEDLSWETFLGQG